MGVSSMVTAIWAADTGAPRSGGSNVATLGESRHGRHGPDARSTAPEGKQPMANADRTRIIPRRTPESAAMVANVKRAMAITATLNRLTYDDADEVRALFSDLIGKTVDANFSLIPPFYTEGGVNIRVGRNVFVNQNCTFYDLGGIDIADDVMIGPNVSIITSGHPLEPSQRRAFVIAKPVVIERNVWIATGATIIGGVTVGENSVVAAGSVVTRDVPPNTLVGGNPARVIRSIAD
jgi:acetyltransferase-like isoleucine patch superfamily enzyme